MDDYLTTLRWEFAEEPGTFLMQLRVQLIWDKAAFSRLTAAMLACCQAYTAQSHSPEGISISTESAVVDETPLPRWIAEGFWYYSWFVQSWTTHPAWESKTAQEPAYYDAAYDRLSDLAYWLFTGEPLYTNVERGYAPM